MSGWEALDGEPVPADLPDQLDALAAEAGLDDVALVAPIPQEQADPDAAGPWTAPRRPAALWAFLDRYDEVMALFVPGVGLRELNRLVKKTTGFDTSFITRCVSTRTPREHKAKLRALQQAMDAARISKWESELKPWRRAKS